MQAYKTSQGNWQVNFSEGGKQKTLYLGREFTSASADRVARIVTDILACRNRGDSLPLEIFRQIEMLPERIQKSFERLGLIGGIVSRTLENLLESFYKTKSHLKPGTQTAYKVFGDLLVTFFGKDCRLGTIEKSDCERFRNQYLSDYSVCTVSRGIRRCRAIFRFAVESGWLQKNPFDKVCGVRVDVNVNRQFYVDREMIYKVLACCRDDHDRLLLSLARFGGLRIPSEIRRLRYSDFSDNVIRVHRDTKTGAREVPLFGEIREIFDRIVNLRKIAGTLLRGEKMPEEFVFANLRNFRSRILLAIRESGVKCWEKLFVNLRSSCITDMAERGYSEKTLDAMFGNSAAIRSRHYVQFRKEREYARVLADDAAMLQKLREGGAENVLSSMEIDDLLVLRDLLVSHFGSGKKAG